MLQHTGQLRNPQCCAAFRAVDRSAFWVDMARSVAYTDMPLRHGRLHISAPHIYARALESMLPLETGMSFLNIGSGTGYFSSIVSELLGKSAVHDGVDIWPETVAHAQERCHMQGNQHIKFTVGNVYNLDVDQGMRYDRIYMGACANARSKYLYKLLEVGGVLIGPFQAGRSQQLRKVVRCSETHFTYEVLSSVQFASLVEPPSISPLLAGFLSTDSPQTGADESSSDEGCSGLPGVPFTFALREPSWSPAQSRLYPASFREAVSAVMLGRPSRDEAVYLPPEIWLKHIFPMCSRRWFDASSAHDENAVGKARAFSALGKRLQMLHIAQSLKAVTQVWSVRGERQQRQLRHRPPPPRPPPLLYEALGDGPDHIIGSQADPDDVEDTHGLLVSLLEAEATTNRGVTRHGRLWPRLGSCLNIRGTSLRCQRVASNCVALSRSFVRCLSAFVLSGAR